MTQLAASHHDTAQALQGAKPGRPVKLHVEIHGRRELFLVERRRQRGAHGIVEHRREKSTLHVPGRIEENLNRLKPGLDRAALAVDLGKLEAERLRAWRYRQPAVYDFPEKRILVHDAALALSRMMDC
jgi:hypothetical protein